MTELLSEQQIVLFLKAMRLEPKGTIAALANLTNTDWTLMVRVAKRGFLGGSEQVKWMRARLSHIIPLIRSGRLQFERRSGGRGAGKKNLTRMFPVMVEQPVEERLVLHYPAEYMRSIARGPNDLSYLWMQPLRHRVHVGRRGSRVPQVQGHGAALGAGRGARRYP